MNKRAVGKQKEEIAVEYIKKIGYKVIAQNYRNRYGEIDIIAEDNEYVFFIEVKYRKNRKYGSGEESVNAAKCRKIYMLSQQYIIENNIKKGIRYDVVAIENDELRYIKNYFWGDEIGF